MSIEDGTGDLSALSTRYWDAVADVAAYDSEVVRRSTQALTDAAERYVFVFTVSVYADHSVHQVEGAPVIPLTSDNPAEDLYGARKAATEAFGDRALIARTGLIVGPRDPTDRFAYWPRRIARGGRILAPGDPADPIHFTDVRDLGGWIAEGYRRGRRGVFNVTGEPPRSVACWASAWPRPLMGVPLWVAGPGWERRPTTWTCRARSRLGSACARSPRPSATRWHETWPAAAPSQERSA